MIQLDYTHKYKDLKVRMLNFKEILIDMLDQ